MRNSFPSERPNKHFGLIIISVTIAVAVALTLLLGGCRSAKTFHSSTESSTIKNQQHYDSLRVQDSLRITKHYTEKLDEMQTDISFYQSNETALVDALNEIQDSLTAKGFLTEGMEIRINRILDSLAVNPCSKSTVKVNKDGSYEVTGQIKNLNLKIKELQKQLDSTAEAGSDSTVVVKGDTEEKEDTKTEVSKSKKTGWPFWVWLMIGYAAGLASPSVYKKIAGKK